MLATAFWILPKTFMHTICRLQREQPACRFKAKTLFHCAQMKQLKQECVDIKGNLYNHFFIITSTDSWTFRTFHPSLHKPVAPLCCSSFHKKASKDEKIILTEAEKHISDDKKLCTIFNNFFSKVVSDSKNTHTFSINYHWNVWKTPQYSFQKDYSSEGIESYLRLKHKKQLLDEWYSHQSY